MGKMEIFTLTFGLILVGAINNAEGEGSRRTIVGAETWLKIRSAFPDDERSSEIRREELRGAMLGHHEMRPSDAQKEMIQGLGSGKDYPRPRYFNMEKAPAKGLSGIAQ